MGLASVWASLMSSVRCIGTHLDVHCSEMSFKGRVVFNVFRPQIVIVRDILHISFNIFWFVNFLNFLIFVFYISILLVRFFEHILVFKILKQMIANVSVNWTNILQFPFCFNLAAIFYASIKKCNWYIYFQNKSYPVLFVPPPSPFLFYLYLLRSLLIDILNSINKYFFFFHFNFMFLFKTIE